jgi:hypothetical protein
MPSLQHAQLLSQGQILQGQVTVVSKSRIYENGQPSQCLNHGLECGGNDLNNQRISRRWRFGEGHEDHCAHTRAGRVRRYFGSLV